jgi:hypothetical protein
MRHPIPPAMPGLPVLGNLLEFNRDRYGLLQRGYDPSALFLVCVWGLNARRC